jgi:hypothetical protein
LPAANWIGKFGFTEGVVMKRLPRWVLPLVVVGIVGAVILAAGKFADQPTIFARGDIALASELIDKAKGIETLFIVVFDADNPMPMPYGAMRDKITLSGTSQISDFILTPERLQIMRPDAPVPKNFRLKVRLDRDGQAGPDQPGDLVGQIDRVAYGTDNIHLSITQVVQ